MRVSHAGNSEVSILNRILRPNAPTFSPEAAQDILALDFDQADKERMRQLSARGKGTSLISTVCEGMEPRGHARKRLMQTA